METIKIKITKGDEYARTIATIALCQINPRTRIFQSWGVEKRICIYVNDMPALGLLVNGFIHKGWVFVALNEGTDTYEVFTTMTNTKAQTIEVVKHIDDVYCDMLIETIDGMVEKDQSWTDEEYEEKIDKWLATTSYSYM